MASTRSSSSELAPPRAPGADALGIVLDSLRRPYRVSPFMVALCALVPLYIFIGEWAAGRPVHTPALPLDAVFPVVPAWALVYGALYGFLIALPLLVVREDLLLRRTFLAYLLVWTTAYVCFVTYPTAAPRPPELAGEGFALWGLRFLYAADPPYNCFPSLHVAHSFVSAIACFQVHRRVGLGALAAAVLVALSTLFTRQHYVLDVVAGAGLAAIATFLCFRRVPRPAAPLTDRRAAPYLALAVMGSVLLLLGGVWIAYRLGGGRLGLP